MREWHKSSYSSNHGGNCVEVSEGPRTFVRDSQQRHLGFLSFPAREWASFLRDVKDDAPDRS
ncbi:DUF397 domain-containing protein [Streptomonospora sp. S1-112]|uniref:DUF397 domain-containing protein n=1 Tax=Streptomonospora mangrovi TaxID=2883123 RepID=A0A9X3NSF7_9ACTN|nr:DUF397 domain-containing protein [Streptomonospora mangrovi]MDA0567498.1 DUF397 domain-containing protein [Streptomonospora mangrovi]